MVDPPSDEEIAARLRKVREEIAELGAPELEDSVVEARMGRSIDDDESRRFQFPDPPELTIPAKDHPRSIQTSRQHEAASYHGIALGMQMAYIVVGTPALGLGIGWLFDRWGGGNVGVAIGTVTGMVVGVAIAIKMSNESAKKP